MSEDKKESFSCVSYKAKIKAFRMNLLDTFCTAGGSLASFALNADKKEVLQPPH
jgi:hypothetical protein